MIITTQVPVELLHNQADYYFRIIDWASENRISCRYVSSQRVKDNIYFSWEVKKKANALLFSLRWAVP